MSTLILFPRSYPYAEHTFLDPEIKYLTLNFDRVIIVPEKIKGKKHPVPGEVQVEESYALTNQSNYQSNIKHIFGALFSRLFYEDILNRPLSLFQLLALKRVAILTYRAERIRKWVCDFIKSERLDPKQCLFYTYWLNQTALGIGLAKKQYPQIMLISRAHGVDLYEEQNNPPYIPFQAKTLSFLERLFPDSQKGTNYIAKRYPWFAPLCETARLGVKDRGIIASCSIDGIFRIASCSFMVPIKRLDLLLKGISYAAKLRPEQEFEWHHFGIGPLKNQIEDLARASLPANVNRFFHGYPSVDYLFSCYKNKPFDLFMNVSRSEGTPVSIMEAISCGIPVVATAVGGNPEIVSDQNGKLLSSNPTPDEMAQAIFSILDNPDLAAQKRKGSRRVWQEKYNADVNLKIFTDGLIKIRKGS